MRTAKRITTACLTAIMIFQALAPSTEVFAQELDAVMEASVSAARAAGNTARSVQDAVATALQDADQAASDDTAATPGADTGTTEDGNGSTNAGESQDSTTDGAGGGAASTEGDASQDDATADDGTTDEEQMNDADADAAAQANTTYEYSTVDKLKDAIGDANVTVEGDKVTKVTIGTSEDLIKLSNADPTIYQDAALTKGGATGSGLNLCNTVTAADGKPLSFLGLGAPNTPFKGSFDLGTSPIVLNRPLFNNVELSADMTLALTWEGTTSDPVVATTITGGDHKLAVNITAATLSSPLLGSVSGELRLDVNYAAKGNETLAINIQSKTDNAGLLVNTLADAASLSVEKLTLPGTYSGDPTIQTTKDGTSAGGLIGVCGNGATVAINGNIDLSAFSVKGRAASGGLIGKATSLNLTIANGTTIKPARNVGDAASACSGGVIGDVSFARGFTVTPNMFDLGDLVTLGASQRAGALFGMADISTGDIVVQGGAYKSKLASGKGGGVSGSYGGLVGKVFATAKGDDESLRALVVEKDADKKTCSIAFDLASELSDAGGVVCYVGDSANPNSQPVAVVLNGVTVACKGDASARTDTGKFGGAVGVVDTRNALDVRDFTLTSDKAIGGAVKNRAAGIAGSAWNAVIKFSGITDLSGASFAENATTGQLVYEDNNALIFAVGNGSNGNMTDEGATGWTFRRSGKASKTDDIATYGEVIRLGDSFITLDPSTHKLTLPASLAQTNGAYALTTAEDFAKLAITWQTNGYYSMVNGVTENNLNGLQSSTITVNDTIDLTGTGLTGFTQDRASDSQVFSGALNGDGTIKLAVGEAYGKRGNAPLGADDISAGNGKIYRHGRLGLFAAINGATVSNVTIAGSMKFDNGVGIDAGSLAGTVAGGLTLSGATCKTNIACDDTLANDVNVGGIAGSVSAASTVTLQGNSKAQATITAARTLNGNMRVGGAVGYVSDYASTFNVAGLEVGGEIKTGDCAGGKIAQVGGLIGCIAQSTYNAGEIVGSADKYVNISGLSFSAFKMNVGRNGDALKGTGGLLGYSWGKTTVTIGNTAVNNSDSTYALKTSNGTTVTANDSTEVGGLVYAASGHWIINNYAIDLSGTTIHADAAQTLGVLVCRGCKVDNKTTYGVENYIGLYLEDGACWETAYRVPSGEGAIVAPGVTSFDEWVGSGVKPSKGSKLMDAGCNAVVSLHTRNDKLDMDGDATNGNSYQNRSTFGQSHKTNGNTRYFYNLDKAYDRCEGGFSGGQINTADKLLLWSAFCYAPAGIRSTIVPDGTTGLDGSITITGTIDLAGYSYYPTQPIGEVTVNNAAITFYYSKIKAEQNGNKLNSDATQHENMHCGLFRTVANGDLTVSNVTLGGTVGPVINDGKSSTDAIGAGGSSSGALVCRYVCGSSDGSGTKIRKISIDDLTLNNLIVDGANSATDANAYMPLLINEMQKYVSLNAKNIKTTGYTSGTKAATSLFGKLGVGSEADQVTAKFERISLPSQNSNTIFTHASLLESFGYKSTGTGSADYTFTKADANAGMVTYGSEIDAENKEYSGKQLWYYDEATYGAVSGYVTVDGKKDGDVRPWFGDYLPYVYKGKATEDGVQYHEIKVNQRIPKLVEGCGTYGDPYAVKDAAEMNAIANYINNQTALDGWEVTIVVDQSTLCNRRRNNSNDNEITYVYKQANDAGEKWEKRTGDNATDHSATLSDDMMHRYIQSAYYSIEPTEGNTITLDGASFGGFGNRANPFRGVIVGNFGSDNKNATIKIENNKGSLRGLISYSYGSVVRSLNINYVNAQATITYSAKDSDGVPTAFFGGVIGCILGGDNIIDGVVVNNPNNGSTTYRFTVTGSSHLVPIGGYVGAIAGGGVIFRNTGDSWRGGTKEKFKPVAEGGANYGLYDNPYVGRVIDGYAFSEGCARTVDNGDANYKINELTKRGASCVTTTGTDNKYLGTNAEAPVTMVENAQGLLVLSAIISSGAGAGAAHTNYSNNGVFRGSKAYWGSDSQDPAICGYLFGNKEYGKVRNASYANVGKPESAAGDFEIAKNDDQKAPGKQGWHGPLDHDDNVNSPYLVASYAADYQTGYVCASKSIGMSLEFKQGDTYDMTDYGTGYVGLNGRYYSNACNSNEAATDRDRITPHVATIDGNGATITVGTKGAAYGVVEYADDDYKVSGVGGLLSTVMFTSSYVAPSVTANDGAQVKDLTFSNCNVALTYIDTNGEAKPGEAPNDLTGAGLLAGATANYDDGTCGIYCNVQMKNCTVSGAKSVGGLLGSSGRARRTTREDRTYMVEFSDGWGPAYLHDCSYTGLNVTGEKNVGGYVGTVASACGVWTTAGTGVSEKTVAANSTITATGTTPYVGGVLGYAKSSDISVNTNVGTTEAVLSSSTAVISGVNVLATGENTDTCMGAGGVLGSAYSGVISMSNVRIDGGDGSKNALIGDETGKNTTIRNAGGLIGEVTTSIYRSNVYWFEGCSVENIDVAGTNQCSGGLIGYFYSNDGITCNNIAIESATIKGSWSGGLLGAIHNGSDVINVTNTRVSNTTFSGTSNGGIAGDGRGQFHLVNVLMDGNTYKKDAKQGVLLGEVDTGDNRYSLSAAGVDVKPGDGKTTSDLPPMVYTTNAAAVNKKTYIAFGDYNDKLAVPGKGITFYGADDTATTAASPYVTTSPVSTLAVRASNGDTTDRYLFGDGAAIDTAAAIQSEVIQSKAGTSFPGRYTYTNIGGINDNGAYQNTSSYNAKSVASMFNVNNDASDSKVATDFPVLVISGTDNTTVKSYLNIITNGGFSDACRLNNENGTNPHVTAKAEVFQLKNGVFVKDKEASNNPTLRVVNNGKNNMSFSPSSDWDNGKGRFTLLTVTFTEAGQSYNVQVPIIVKRKLEIDFTATYDYGTQFKEKDYANLGKDAHVLTSFGEPMTGLLTWTYNSANGKEVDFGWDSYMAAGGSMKGLGKSILFNGADGRLPQGTQLTLIDANVDGKAGGREYHYTVGEGGATSVSLSGNAGFEDSAGNPYQERWLSEILDVYAEKDGAGTWAECNNEAEATAKAKIGDKWTLFKVAGANVPSNKRYTLKVPKEKDTGREKRASESVYLVVNVPKSGDGGTQASINGFTASSIDSNSSGARISWNLHHVLRTGGEDNQNSTASTYSILSNYEQSVVDNINAARIPVSKSEDGAAYVLSLDVKDRVTFSPSQYYTESDHLFYQLDTSLCRYGANNNLMGVSSFPSGTSAIAKFYVAIGGQNYRWNGGDWEPCDVSMPAFTQTVTDTGDDSLKLKLDYDLAGIRKIATDGSFTVRTVVEEIRLTPDGCNKVISLSKQSGEDACTKMSYTAKLSTRKEGLNTSSLTQTKPGNVGYYRMDTGDTTITLSAPDKSQLGINVDDLRPIADGTIGLGATYELGGLSNAAEAIANADSVVYTLELQRRGTDGTYESVTDDISNYVTVTESKLAAAAPSGSTITFTDSKENGKFKTQNGDTTFSLPFTVKVNTQVEQREQFYANYRLVMRASLVKGDVASAKPQSPDYVTYTLTRVNLNGIDH